MNTKINSLMAQSHMHARIVSMVCVGLRTYGTFTWTAKLWLSIFISIQMDTFISVKNGISYRFLRGLPRSFLLNWFNLRPFYYKFFDWFCECKNRNKNVSSTFMFIWNLVETRNCIVYGLLSNQLELPYWKNIIFESIFPWQKAHIVKQVGLYGFWERIYSWM